MTHTLLAALSVATALLVTTAPAAAQNLKVLTHARTGQFDSLDPPRQFDGASIALVALVYNRLLNYAYLERPYQLTPDLLESMPELGADKLTWTFRLKKGVRFHDNACFPGSKGRELTADDVLFSLRRFADANVNTKSWFLMEGAVVGLDDFHAASRKAGPAFDAGKVDLAGFRKQGSHEFTIKLARENPLFLFALATTPSSIVPVEAVQFYKERFAVNPVGKGPFTLKDVDRKGVLRFLKYPNYHGVYPGVGELGDAEKSLLKDAGRKLPLVDVVQMPLIEEAQPAALRFLSGELDWRTLDRANFTKMVTRNKGGDFQLNDEFASLFNLHAAPALDIYYIGINMKDPLLGRNKALRQALAHLVDTRGRIDVLLGGRGRKLQSLVPLDLPGSERDTGATFREYDVAAARKLLAEAGFAEGKGLPLLSVAFPAADADTRNYFDFMKVKAAAAGVQLKATFTDNPTFIRSVEGGNFQLASDSWEADYADAENFYQLLYSKNVAPGPNFPAFSHAGYDQAYEASRLMTNGAARLANFKTMNDILRDEVPVIIGHNSIRVGVSQKWLLNFKRNLMRPEFEFLDIDPAPKTPRP